MKSKIPIDLSIIAIVIVLFLVTHHPKDTGMHYGIQTISMIGDTNYSYLVKELGVEYVREDVRWERIEKSPGIYDFTFYDQVVNNWTSLGIKPMLLVFYGNSLYAGTSSKYYPDVNGDASIVPYNDAEFNAFVKAYGNYAYAMANHYKGKVKYYEIWNEYNGNVNPGIPPLNQTVRYLTLLKEASNRIKQADPNAKIVSAGIGTWDELLRDYIQPFIIYGGLDYIDYFGAHPYCSRLKYDNMSECPEIANLQKIYNMMVQYNKPKPIWITEIGMPTGGCAYSRQDINNTSAWVCRTHWNESNQAIAVTNVFKELKKYPYVTNVFWFCFRDRWDWPITNIEHNYCIVNVNGTVKPAYNVYKDIIKANN